MVLARNTFDQRYRDLVYTLRRRMAPPLTDTNAASLGALATAVAANTSSITSLNSSVAANVTSINALNAAMLTQQSEVTPRRVIVALPSISIGGSSQAITWTPDITTAGGYIVVPTVITSATNLGLLLASLSAGTKLPGGCTILIRNNALISIGGVSLEVMIHPVP